MILERILKKFSNTKNNGYCTTRKKGTLPFFYNVLQEFTEKLKKLTFHIFPPYYYTVIIIT